jgi:hypothetical protein
VVGPSDLLNQTGGGGSFRRFTFLSTQPPLDRQIKFLVHLSIYFGEEGIPHSVELPFV